MTDSWGPWRKNAAENKLWHRDKDAYYVDLARCSGAAQILDWVAQVSHKEWASPATVGHLVRALDALLGLQQNHCGGHAGRVK